MYLDDYVRRFQQFFNESELLVPDICRAIEAKDEAALRKAAAESNRLSDTHLGNLVPQTRSLVTLAMENGAIGNVNFIPMVCLDKSKLVAASAFGAGFGGSVWAIVSKSRVRVGASTSFGWES